MSIDLLPCQFCGKPPGTKTGPPALAKCVTPGCEGKNLAAATIAEWNSRPTQPTETIRGLNAVREALEAEDYPAHVEIIDATIKDVEALVRVLQATQGRIMNAKIDLGGGHTKAQVGRTLGGIIEFIDGALASLPEQS